MGCSLSDINAELLRHQVLSLQVIQLSDRGVMLSHPECERDIILQNCDLKEGTQIYTGQWLDLELRVTSLQKGWCYWATMPLQLRSGPSYWSDSTTGSLQEPIRRALNRPKPRSDTISVLRNFIKKPHAKKSVIRFAKEALQVLERAPKVKSWPGQHPLTLEKISIDESIDLLLELIKAKELWSRLESVEDLEETVLDREILAALIWSEDALNQVEWADSWKKWIGNYEFVGNLENVGSGYGFISCEAFRNNVFVLRDDLIEGDLIQGARCYFQGDVVTYDGKLRFVARLVRSEGRRVIETLPYWTMNSPENASPRIGKNIKEELRQGKAVLVLFKSAKGVQDGLGIFANQTGLSRKSVKWLDEVYPQASLPKNGAWNGALICRPNTLTWEVLKEKREKNKVVRTLYTLHAGALAEQEREGWTVLMDETGACDDFRQHRQKNGAKASAMMALIVPPGISLPPCPSGFHAYESPWEESEALRQELISQRRVIALGWSYMDGAPLENQNLLTADFHAQMWKHAMDCCLEVIAQNSESYEESVPVRIYLEQVGALTPQEKGLFDDRMTSLLESCQGRKGWEALSISPPRIVSKDVHPWMGYVDVLGSVFRSSGEVGETVKSVRSLRVSPRVVMMEYRQDQMEALSQMIMMSSRQPLQALLLMASLEGAHLEGFEIILEGLVEYCIKQLGDTDMMALHENLERILSRQPECYSNAEWICCHMPEGLYDDERFRPSLRLLGLSNQMLSLNQQGNTRGVFEFLKKGISLCQQVKASGLRMRFYRQVAEAYAKALQWDPCLELLNEHLDEAWGKVEDVAGAQRLISLRMQVHGMMGETKSAMELFDYLYPFLMTAADERKMQIYKAHLRVDQGAPGKAWMELQEFYGSQGLDVLVQAAMKSRFLLALLLKLEVLCPRLNKKQRKVLLSMEIGRGYPWMNIAYCGMQLDKSEKRQQRLESLIRVLTEPTRSASMEMVRYCFWSQLIADGDVDGQLNFDLAYGSAKTWLKEHPMEPEKPRGFLAPLKFYYY
jgi:hypothetical protein